MSSHTLAIDLGGTNTKIAVVDENLKICEEASIPTLADQEASFATKKWLDVIDPWRKNYTFASVGMGSPGPLDSEEGVLIDSPNLKKWTGFNFKTLFKKTLGVPLFLENDANCAALGEWHYHQRIKNLIMITLGTGVGSGVVSEGILIRGTKGYGVEAGHMTIDMNGPRCACGKRGCFEAFVGAKSLIALYNRRSSSAVTEAAEIFRRAKSGHDAVATELVALWTRSLAVGIGNLINLFNPSLVTLTGGLSRAFPDIRGQFDTILLTEAFEPSLKCTKVVVSQLQEKAGIYGAAIWAQQHHI